MGATAVALIVIAGLAFWARDGAEMGYRLRAETLVPTQLSVRPDDVDCPSDHSASPVEHLDAGALADALPLYDGDLIVVRVLVIPTVERDGSIDFAARWPEAVVGDGGPTCVFIVGDPSDTTQVDWLNVDGGIDVSVSDAAVGASTELEVWLVADNPDTGATFRTTIIPDGPTDDVVIDPLGGRVNVDRRPGSQPAVSVVAQPVDGEDRTFEVMASVSNPTARSRSLDVVLGLTTDGEPDWTVASTSNDVTCRDGRSVECSLGDIAAGDVVEVTAVFTQNPSWEPAAVACESPPEDLGFGLCVEASAAPLEQGASAESTASAFVALPRPTTDGLIVSTDPNPVLGRVGLVTEFDFTVETSTTDVGSVAIVGSDCDEIGRELNEPLEDTDAFLEVGETWRYSCRIDLDGPTTLRLDLAATDGNGVPVSTSYETTVRVVDPSLELSIGEGDTIVVTNTGTGAVRDVAVTVPGCDSIGVEEGQGALLEEGATVSFECVDPVGDLTGAVAYGTDEIGLGVVGRFR